MVTGVVSLNTVVYDHHKIINAGAWPMGMPALRIDPEIVVDKNIAVLEADVRHIKSDIADLKIDLRDVRREMVEGFATVNQRMDTGFATINERMDKGSATLNERMDKSSATLNEKIDKTAAELNQRIDTGLATVNQRMEAGFAQARTETAELRNYIDNRFSATHADIAGLRGSIQAEIAELRDNTQKGFITLQESLNSAKFWALGLYAALAVTIFGVMARGLGWI